MSDLKLVYVITELNSINKIYKCIYIYFINKHYKKDMGILKCKQDKN